MLSSVFCVVNKYTYLFLTLSIHFSVPTNVFSLVRPAPHTEETGAPQTNGVHGAVLPVTQIGMELGTTQAYQEN